MGDGRLVTHDEALKMIDEHLGDKCYVGLLVERHDREHAENPVPVFHLIAELGNKLAPKPPRLDPGAGLYDVGTDSFHLPPLAGTIRARDNGLDFELADTVTLRIAWRGSPEVGDFKPDPKVEAWLRSVSEEEGSARTP